MSETTFPRGYVGTTPKPTTLADESYLDFVQSFRKLVIREIFPVVAEAGQANYDARRDAGQVVGDDIEDIASAFSEVPVTRSFQRFVRSQQEMMWRRSRESLLRIADQHVRDLDAAEQSGPATLASDPDFVTPGWARQEIHLQPGGYTDDPIAGLVFHVGTRAFYEGMNDDDGLHRELAEKMTLPADGELSRVLDIGCSIGQASLALKTQYPEAEVCALDVALPLLRYGRKIANDAGLAVHFRQGLGQDTGYPDDHFDSVLSYILFHETPVATIPDIIREVHRILRPGGTFCIFEFPNSYGEQLPPAQRFLIDYDSRNNCEPYSIDFVYCNFKGMLADAGFEIEEGPATRNAYLQSNVARKKV
ncbi:MAG: class I SAM-dependent methyltransferase [Chromatocurvus sp.]